LWSYILLVLISLFTCVVIYRRLSPLPHPEYLSYTILLLNAVMFGMMIAGSEHLDRIIELMLLSVFLLVLVLLLISVRQIQPQYSRQPVLYAYFPLLILPFYAYFVDNEMLEFITNATIQATALLVYLGLVISYFSTVRRGYLLFISILTFTAAFGLYWYPVYISVPISAIHLLVGVGMIISGFKFPSILLEHKR